MTALKSHVRLSFLIYYHYYCFLVLIHLALTFALAMWGVFQTKRSSFSITFKEYLFYVDVTIKMLVNRVCHFYHH